jgi:predicted glycosyltransferase
MNREAAALGVPVYSVFRGKIGAVDKYLSKMRRLTLIEGCEDLQTKILLARRERPAKPQQKHTAALSYIVERIVEIAELQHSLSDPVKHSPSGKVRSQDATV